ncbi:hypothetical protein ACB094_06G166500 [Castanea mollissima]
MSMESRTQLYKKVKPFVAIILVQLGHAGMSIIGKLALNKGMNPRVFIAYRYAVATVIIAPFAIVYDRKKRAKLTYSIFAKIMLLALLGPVAYQNLYYEGMKLTTATYSRALFNVVPVFTFAMAWILRLEKVNIRRRGSQAKVLGTIVTIGGAMLMTLVKGPSWIWPWTYKHGHQESTSAGNKQDVIKGALMMLAGFFCWSGYVNLQAITLKSYPTELSLTALITLMATLENTIVALAMEWGNVMAWSMRLDIMLLAVVYAKRSKLTFSVFAKVVLLALLGPVINQNLFYTGMNYTTATFSSILQQLPAFAFSMAWILRLEKVNIRRRRGQAKVLGTIFTVGRAILKGIMLNLPWTNENAHQVSTNAANKQDVIKGALMILAGSVGWSGFIILQVRV